MDNHQKELLLTAPRIPARLNLEEAGVLLGFILPEMVVILRTGLLKEAILGKPSRNGRKLLSRDAILNLCSDKSWLHRATIAVANRWRIRNEGELLKRHKLAA
jgi:hypothetical protein